MVSVQASRFSLLKIDDDFDEDKLNGDHDEKQKPGSQQQQNKKKNKKKKKAIGETQELRNFAFGGGAKSRPNSSASNGKTKGRPEDWDMWKKQDEEFTKGAYQNDLQKAILESKLQFEEQAQALKENSVHGVTNGTENGKQKKKKKVKSHKIPMTLDEFNQMRAAEKKQQKQDSSDEEMLPSEPAPTTNVLDPDSKYFKGCSEEVRKILQKEKIQASYKKQYAVENVRTQKFQDEIEKRSNDVKTLIDENKTLKDELKQVKKRNQQLCVILGQGEMKDKHKILLELEDLKQVRDELTQEVSRLNTSLQKERSKSGQSKSDGGAGSKPPKADAAKTKAETSKPKSAKHK